MDKTAVVFALLAISVAGAIYGAYHHSRFIKVGGQRGFSVVTSTKQTEAMRVPYRGMRLGYGTFLLGVALMLAITAL
jgi:hypothetical protein